VSVRRGYRVVAAATVLAAIGAAFLVGCDTNPAVPEAPDAAAADAWRLVTPRPFPVTITGLWGDPVTLRTMAVGDDAALLVKEGSAWRQAPPPTDRDLYGIHGCDWEHVFLTAENGVYRFDGRRWSRIMAGPLPPSTQVWCRAPDDVMVATRDGDTYHFDGSAWTHRTMGVSPPWRGNWLTATDDGYLALADQGAMVRWSDGRWEPPVTVGDGDKWLRSVCRRRDSWYTWPEFVIGASDGTIFGIAGEMTGVIDRVDGAVLQLATGLQTYYALIRMVDGCRIKSGYRQVVADIGGVDTGALLVVPWWGLGDPGGDAVTFGGPFGTLREGWLAAGPSTPPPIMHAVSGGIPMVPDALAVLPSGEFFGASWRQPFLLHGLDGVVDKVGAADADLWRVVATPLGSVYVVTAAGGIARLRPDGSFAPLDTPEGIGIWNLWCDRDGGLWTESGGSLWRGDGQAWERVVTLPGGFMPDRVLPAGPHDVYLIDSGRVAHWDGHDLTEFRDAEFKPSGGAVLAADRSGMYCCATRYNGDVILDPGIYLVRPDGAELVAVVPRLPAALALEPDGTLLAVVDGALLHRRDGAWEAVPHPATDAGIPIDSVAGNPAAGYYTVTRTGVIHYLDTGGTGQWQ